MTMLRRMTRAAALVAVSAMALVGCQSQAPESESAQLPRLRPTIQSAS
ncbi:hypothetical protein I4J33_08555 [Corynebacterium belfantii]|nr:hypothetical protein [Corynebacterium belfantii]MBG9326483.1 hypothetical protein [Corynebacterium belfantii]